MTTPEQHYDILLLGLLSSGKQALLDSLSRPELHRLSFSSSKSIGLDISHVLIRGRQRSVAKVGEPMVRSWAQFCQQAKMFVVDCSDQARMVQNQIEWMHLRLLAHNKGFPLALVFSKVELITRSCLDLVDEGFPTEECPVFWVSAHQKINLEILGEWLGTEDQKGEKEGGACAVF